MDFVDSNVKSESVTFPTYKRIKVVACWLTNSFTETEDDLVQTNIHTNYNLQIVNADGVPTSTLALSNYEYINFYNTRNDDWVLNLIKAGEKHTDECDWGAVTWVSE